MPRSLWLAALLVVPAAVGVACGGSPAAPSPFAPNNEAGAGGEAGAPPVPTGTVPDPMLGGPCVDSDQCDDDIDCTDDTCDTELGRCRFSPVHSRCGDDVYCNGGEICVVGVGCDAGEPVSCSDGSSCTIDVCVEATRKCESRPRDADGDGDPIRNCGGGDCRDDDPNVNSSAAEVCQNGLDDDCDGTIDEPDCAQPANDTCASPLEVEGSGSFRLSLAAARLDFPLRCVMQDPMRRDVVVALTVPEEPTDIDVAVSASEVTPSLGLAESCTDLGSELACAAGVPTAPDDSGVARVVLRGLEPGTYPLFLNAVGDAELDLKVMYRPPAPEPENETCETAIELVPDENQVAELANAEGELATTCGGKDSRELVYYFELESQSDVEVAAVSLDDYGTPWLSLRGSGCAAAGDELGCRRGSPSSLYARALDPGRYYVAVGSSGPSDIDVRLTLRDPSPGTDAEGCDEPPALKAGETRELDLQTSIDAVDPQCLAGAPDGTFGLTLDEPSDVLLVARLSDGDVGALSLTGDDCSEDSRLACNVSDDSPLRVVSSGVAPGEYRAIVESALGAPLTLTAFARSAATPVLVGFSDTCEDAVTIPETGGRFVGNTANAEADYEGSCDFGTGIPGGAPEQMLKLVLSEEKRVVLDMAGSSYSTLLAVREAGSCPGPELLRACAPGYVDNRSYLDRVLPEGEYWVQVDGYNRGFGNWVLDVFVTDP